jgi:SulP family sulfate permease
MNAPSDQPSAAQSSISDPNPSSRYHWGLYVPKLITVLREGYSLAKLRGDVMAGLTVAVVALPLSMALAIASGTTADRGLCGDRL